MFVPRLHGRFLPAHHESSLSCLLLDCQASPRSWPFPDCFWFVCLSLGPERRDCKMKETKKIKKNRRRRSYSISWTDRWGGWLWHVMTQTASFLPLLSRCWPYKWCCRLLPYTIRHVTEQDGALSPFIHAQAPGRTAQRSLSSLTFHKRKADYGGGFLSRSFVRALLSLSSSCLCFIVSVSVGLRQVAEASLTGVWVLITHVCALISGLQLPASSLLHASEWGYISLSLWPEIFPSISFGLSFSVPTCEVTHRSSRGISPICCS